MTPTPHDALFKATFSNPARAAELLAAILGPLVAARIDLANLRLVDGSFIDEALDDLGDGGSAALRARALSAAVLLPLLALLEGRSDRSLADLLHGWADLLRGLRRTPDGLGALRLLLRYLCEVRDDVAAHPVAAILRDIDPTNEDTMPTTAEVLRQEGHLRGHKEGLRQAVKIMLRTRFGDVPERMLRRVDEADVATLERMTARAYSVATLDELLDG